ncbi:GntR family transcriptional regulator [Anaerobacillus sp. MEB173]|uniref:GntR family transcriptional regulator n=1 Tax=Anaerobacillus sp. MEB173 TaxID=3383345 RepID=UPI003F933E28
MKQGKTKIAYENIKEKIFNGELKPLADISEEKLQEELGISRTPIREALQMLEKEKFVYIYPRKGIIVSGITPELINHIYEVRELIEPSVARAVCHQIPDTWLLKLRQNFTDEPAKLTPEQRKIYFTNLDRELHHKIIYTHNNSFIHNIMDNVMDHTHRIMLHTSTINEKYNVSIQEHIDIIDTFLEKDADQVEKLIREHIINARKNSIRFLYGLENA